MKRKMFYLWLAVAGLAFAAMFSAGCGGSSSTAVYDENSLTMGEIWEDDEALEEIMNRLTSDDIFKLLPLHTETITRGEDGSVKMRYDNMYEYVSQNKEYPEVPYNAEELRTHYHSGDIVLIPEADQQLVNTVRTDLGLPEADAGKFGKSGSLEVYAFASKRNNGIRNLFVYVVPRMGDIVIDSDDVLIDGDSKENDTDDPEAPDTGYEKSEVAPKDYTMRDFQIDRWVHFLRWMGDISVMAAQNSAFASEYKIQAAENSDLASISDAQTETFDFSYANVHTNGPTFNRVHYSCSEFKRTRNNFVTVKIFSAHSFSNGKDYYVVESSTATVPMNFCDKVIEYNGYYRNYLYGFTRSVGTDHYIDGGNMSTGDVALIKNVPFNRNNTTNFTEGMSWSINGKLGVNKDGVSSEVGGGVTYSKSKSWSISEYNLLNDSMKTYPASAKWYADVNTPGGGGHHVEKAGHTWDGVNATAASKNQLQYDSYFMWEVGKNYWQNHSDINMSLAFTVEDGICLGWCRQWFKKYDRFDSSYTTTKTASLRLKQPAHTAVSKGQFAFTASGAASQSFELLAEDNWTIQGIPSWLSFTETSGGATGGSGKLVLFDIKANTTGSPRSATLTVESGRDKVNIQIAQTGN